METGGRAALPVSGSHAEYLSAKLVGLCAILSRKHGEQHCSYLNGKFTQEEWRGYFNSPIPEMRQWIELDFASRKHNSGNGSCEVPLIPLPVVYQLKDGHAHRFFERVSKPNPLAPSHTHGISRISILGRALASLPFLLIWLRQESATRTAGFRWDQDRQLFCRVVAKLIPTRGGEEHRKQHCARTTTVAHCARMRNGERGDDSQQDSDDSAGIDNVTASKRTA